MTEKMKLKMTENENENDEGDENKIRRAKSLNMTNDAGVERTGVNRRTSRRLQLINKDG